MKWTLAKIDELCVVERGASPRPIRDFITKSSDGVNWIKIGDAQVGSKFIFETAEKITPEGAEKSRWVKPGDFILSNSMSFGRPYIMATNGCIHDGWLLLRENSSRLNKDFLYHILGSDQIFVQFKRAATGGVVNNLNSSIVRNLEIPLPPLEVQQEIVLEIEGYQRIIDGARAVVENYRPQIAVDPEWPMVKVGSLAEIVRGSSPRPKGDPDYYGGPIPRLMVADITRDGMYATPQIDSLTHKGAKKSRPMKKGDVIITVSGNPGLPTILAKDACIHDGFVGLRHLKNDLALPAYLYFNLLAQHEIHGSQSVGAVFKNLTTHQIRDFEILLPSIETQQAIVAEIEAEQALVNANRKLIERFEKKIQDTIGRVWGEE